MEIKDVKNHNFKDNIIEIEVDSNGEFSKETETFILEKVQETIDEGIYYTQEEVIDALDKLEEENNKCIKSFILKEQK